MDVCVCVCSVIVRGDFEINRAQMFGAQIWVGQQKRT